MPVYTTHFVAKRYISNPSYIPATASSNASVSIWWDAYGFSPRLMQACRYALLRATSPENGDSIITNGFLI